MDCLVSCCYHRNKISCLCSPLCLKDLKILNISKNSISSLADNVFMGCTKLEQFNARMNVLGKYLWKRDSPSSNYFKSQNSSATSIWSLGRREKSNTTCTSPCLYSFLSISFWPLKHKECIQSFDLTHPTPLVPAFGVDAVKMTECTWDCTHCWGRFKKEKIIEI